MNEDDFDNDPWSEDQVRASHWSGGGCPDDAQSDRYWHQTAQNAKQRRIILYRSEEELSPEEEPQKPNSVELPPTTPPPATSLPPEKSFAEKIEEANFRYNPKPEGQRPPTIATRRLGPDSERVPQKLPFQPPPIAAATKQSQAQPTISNLPPKSTPTTASPPSSITPPAVQPQPTSPLPPFTNPLGDSLSEAELVAIVKRLRQQASSAPITANQEEASSQRIHPEATAPSQQSTPRLFRITFIILWLLLAIPSFASNASILAGCLVTTFWASCLSLFVAGLLEWILKRSRK